uniref:Uncharacterized protein n=1 Tax=Rhizophora mucronata TaxID=61149 RepID=A0A2P2R0J5_RHIMU
MVPRHGIAFFSSSKGCNQRVLKLNVSLFVDNFP